MVVKSHRAVLDISYVYVCMCTECCCGVAALRVATLLLLLLLLFVMVHLLPEAVLLTKSSMLGVVLNCPIIVLIRVFAIEIIRPIIPSNLKKGQIHSGIILTVFAMSESPKFIR